MALKPQDVVTALALALAKKPPTYAALAKTIGISASEAHSAVRRLSKAGLASTDRYIKRPALLDFLIHGLRRTFPAVMGGPTLGVPTGAAAAAIDELPDPEFGPWVWPSKHGTVRGLSLAPLYASVPTIALNDDRLYALLVLVDLLRAGNAREVSHAASCIRKLLGTRREAIQASALDVSSPYALHAIFKREKIAFAISKWSREPPSHMLVRHPLEQPILAAYKDDLANVLSVIVPGETWTSGPAYHVVTDKAHGTRDLVFPGIVDALVARRVIDELEPAIRKNDDGRVFMARRHTNSRLPRGNYNSLSGEWFRYLESTASAAQDSGHTVVIKADIAEFFPSVDLVLARQSIAQRTGAHPSIVGLLFHCLEGWSPRLGYRSAGGLPQDPHDVSGLVAHALLKTIDDVFEDTFEYRYRRFVDDTVFFVESEAHAERLELRYQRALASVGLRPNIRKSEVMGIDRFVALRHKQDFAAITQAAESPHQNALPALTRTLLAQGDALDDAVLRHLYTVHGAQQGGRALQKRIFSDIKRPEIRRYALGYLMRRPLSSVQLGRLLKVFEESKLPGLRIEVARALTTSRYTQELPGAAKRLATWAAAQAQHGTAQPGDGYARGLLLLCVFKYGERSQFSALTDWAEASRLPDPYLRLFYAYVHLCWFEGHLPSWLRYGGAQDFSLMIQLCEDAATGRLEHLPRILAACCSYERKRYVVSAEVLPLLYAIAESPSPTSRSTLHDWLTTILKDEDHSPEDALTWAHLSNLRDKVSP